MMDSIGKPGIAGTTRGVVVLLDDSVTVAADVELDVPLSVELVTSLLEVTTEDVPASDVLVELAVLETTLVLLELVELEVVVAPPPPIVVCEDVV